MPRRARVVVEGGIYHVYNRLARGAELFADPEEAVRFVDLLRKVKARDGLTVLAWCVMSNHYHLAVRIGPVALARTMGYVQARFGQSFNRRTRSSGPRWQSRYKAKLVEEEGYLHQLVMYIHANPVIAGVVDDPAEYVFSGHRELLGNVSAPLGNVEDTLAMFGETRRSARQSYVRAMKAEREQEWLTEMPGRLPWWRREPDTPVEPPAPSTWIDERGVSTGRPRQRLEPQEYLERACEALSVDLSRIASPTRDRATGRLRYLIVGLGIERWAQRPGALATVLGRWPEAVGRWALRAGELRTADSGFRDDFEQLDETLSDQVREIIDRMEAIEQ